MESSAVMGEADDNICKEKVNASDDICLNGNLSCDDDVMEVCSEDSKAPDAQVVDSIENHKNVPEDEAPAEESENEIMEVEDASSVEDHEEDDDDKVNISVYENDDNDVLSDTEENAKTLTNGTDNSLNDDVIMDTSDPLDADSSVEQSKELDKSNSVLELNDSGDVVVIETDSERKENGETCSSPEVEEVINISDKDTDTVNLVTPNKKKIRKSTETSAPIRRSTRNLHKQKSYIEKEDEDPDIEEVTPEDPLADPLRDDKENTNKKSKPPTQHSGSTIVVSDTKRLVEIAANSKATNSTGKKEPTLVIIDTNSILSGRGPVPVSQSQKPASLATSFSMMPVALPAQGVYPPNMRATITPIPMPTMQPKPTPPPAPILPTLTDDMFVVEAPSFIVPYVYEKPPVKPFKEFVAQIGKDLLHVIQKEKKVLNETVKEELDNTSSSKNKKEESEKSEELVKKEDQEKNHESEDENEEKESNHEIKKENEIKNEKTDQNDTEAKQDVKQEAKQEAKNSEDEESSSKENKSIKTEEENSDKKKDETGNTKDDSVKTIDLDDIPDDNTAAKPKTNSYFDNALGQFFINIGFNLVQEFVQTDLLKQQKRKNSREGNTSIETKHAISSLIKNLEYSKENNEPFKLEQRRCEFCSFKTESNLVLAHHLETPHMRNYVYKCNFCPLEVRSPHDILFHMEAEHNTRGRLERAPAFHQCPNCSFEDNQKGKLSRHLVTCLKKFKPERNLEPPHDWEPPAKIPRVPRMKQTGISATAATYQALAQSKSNYQLFSKLQSPNSPSVFPRGRGRPSLLGKINTIRTTPPIIRTNMMYRPSTSGGSVLVPTSYQFGGNQVFQSVEDIRRFMSSTKVTKKCDATTPEIYMSLLNRLNENSSGNKPNSGKVVQQPSISITPLPRQPTSSTTVTKTQTGTAAGAQSADPGSKATFVICEICDGYIKDLEQLRNHMQWIHKVKIHPKMIYNRPPLNCQKCQFRFFTDQGLERHLLGSHGLVTSSMQEAANKSKDAGRCPVCGRVYQWKLLNHVARDHNMTLKPAHLSYKCTVCTATFGMYKQFENHVYSAHSVVAKRVMEKKASSPASRTTSDSLLKPLKINDEITIIPQPAKAKTNSATVSRSTSGSSSDRGK